MVKTIVGIGSGDEQASQRWTVRVLDTPTPVPQRRRQEITEGHDPEMK
jgi:hypothetical protein